MLEANELVPGRKVLVSAQGKLSECLFNARLLQKAKDEGALRTLISLFASQAAFVLEVCYHRVHPNSSTCDILLCYRIGAVDWQWHVQGRRDMQKET
jgi:hypothetical protein